jgi:hypothetical protein
MQTQGFLGYVHVKRVLAVVLFLFVAFLVFEYVSAATIHRYSDRLSDSAPGVYSNHTIQFTTTTTIPPNGFIRFTPDPGDFNIPATNFDIDNVELYVDEGSGYVLRATAGVPSGAEDGVTIVTGTSGNIEVTLNSTNGIPADAEIRLLIGTQTLNATPTDLGILNPSATGTYEYYIATGGGSSSSEVNGKYAIVESVSIAGLDTTETDPPLRFNGAPSGELSGTITSVELSLETNEVSMCRYSTASGTPYSSMGNQFSTTFTTVHSGLSVAVASSTSYTFFVRCIDDEGNVNTDDYLISFTVLPPPEGIPGSGVEPSGDDGGSGTGTGSSGSGTGASAGGSSGTGSAGGGGGGSDGGGFESTPQPYQSGDGRVIITGYAFPKSTIVSLVDGQIAESVTSGVNGAFSITIDAIARGAYTFGVYGVDKNGVKSSTFSTTFTVTGSRGSTLSNINVMPSLKVTPDPASPNSTVTVSGYAIPNATVTVENQNDKTSASLKTFTATSDSSGAWSVTVPTDGFTKGTYKVRAKAKQDEGASTNFSNYTYYGVGEAAAVPRSSDLSRDGKVNLTDFSILLYWWNSDGGASNPPADINGDGRVSLTDFSIMIFNWTG